MIQSTTVVLHKMEIHELSTSKCVFFFFFNHIVCICTVIFKSINRVTNRLQSSVSACFYFENMSRKCRRACCGFDTQPATVCLSPSRSRLLWPDRISCADPPPTPLPGLNRTELSRNLRVEPVPRRADPSRAVPVQPGVSLTSGDPAAECPPVWRRRAARGGGSSGSWFCCSAAPPLRDTPRG